MDAYKAIKVKKEFRYVTFKIKDLKIVVDERGERKESHEEFVAKLPRNKCRFALYDYEGKEGNRNVTKLYFIMWCPENANDNDRVAYSQALPRFKDNFSGIVTQSFFDPDEVLAVLSSEVRA